MEIKLNGMQIEAIKLAIESLPKQEISISEIIENSMIWLLQNYEKMNDDIYLFQAYSQLIAYLELGLDYDCNEKIFDKVLELCGVEKEFLILQYGSKDKKFILTKNRIKTIIRRWRKGVDGDRTLNEVVDDIYRRICNKQCGKYYYVSHYKDGRIFNMYELLISSDEYVLHDIPKKKYYFFEVKT